jgi:hypothetical protein
MLAHGFPDLERSKRISPAAWESFGSAFGKRYAELILATPKASESLRYLTRGGCTLKNILVFVEHFCCYPPRLPQRQRELDWLKGRLDAIAQSLRNSADDIEKTGRARLQLFGNATIGEAVAKWDLPDSGDHLAFPELSRLLRHLAATMDACGGVAGDEFSTQTLTPTTYLALLYVYCCEAMRRQSVPFRHIANILAAGYGAAGRDAAPSFEENLDKRLKRFRQGSKTREEFVLYQHLMKEYLQQPATETPIFLLWVKTRHEYPQK